MLEIILTHPALVTALLVTTVVFLLWKLREEKHEKPIPPGPQGIGALQDLFKLAYHNSNFILLSDLYKRFGKVSLLRSVVGNVCVLSSAQTYRKLYTSKDTESLVFNRKESFLGKHFLWDYKDIVTAGPKLDPNWMKLKKEFYRCIKFYGEGVADIEMQVHTELQRVVNKLDEANGNDVNLEPMVTRSIMSLILALMFGEKDPDPAYITLLISALRKVLSVLNLVYSTVLLAVPWIRHVPFLPFKKKHSELFDIRNSIFLPAFHRSKNTHVPGEPRGMIDRLLDDQLKDASNWMTDEHVIGVTVDIVVGGTGTTSGLLQWVFVYLCHNPEIMRRIQKEIDDNIGDRPAQVADKVNFPYTEAVLWEAMRISRLVANTFPTVADADLVVDGYVIPKDTEVIANIYNINVDPEVFSNPDCFKPERFLDDKGQLVPVTHPVRQGFVPFGVGKRSCPGQAFALSRAFLFVVTILQKFDIRPPVSKEPPSLKPVEDGAVLRPEHCWASFHRRSQSTKT